MLKPLSHYRGLLPEGNNFSLFSMEEHPITLNKGVQRIVRSGLEASLVKGYGAHVFSPPALMHMHGVSITPFVLTEESYGEVKVIMQNVGDRPFIVHPGDRIANVVIVRLGGEK